MFINLKQSEDEVEEQLLGMTIDDDLEWKTHVEGKGGLIPSLNSRLFLLKRLNKCVNKTALKRIADSIFNSKIRYGLQLLGKVRLKDEDETQGWLKSTQLMHNKMTRFLNRSHIKDKISTKIILNNLNLLSVNQMNAQIKLTEGWKISNVENYPTKWALKTTAEDERSTRATSANKIPEVAKSKATQSAYNNDAKKLWNMAPKSIKESTSIHMAKKAIKTFVKSLPI